MIEKVVVTEGNKVVDMAVGEAAKEKAKTPIAATKEIVTDVQMKVKAFEKAAESVIVIAEELVQATANLWTTRTNQRTPRRS